MPAMVRFRHTFLGPPSMTLGSLVVIFAGVAVLDAEVAVQKHQRKHQEKEYRDAYSNGHNSTMR